MLEQSKSLINEAKSGLEICQHLHAAINYEIKHLYINAKGKQYLFSDFVIHEANSALQIFKHSSRWAKIRSISRRYPFVDIAGRIHIIKLISEDLKELEELYGSKLEAPSQEAHVNHKDVSEIKLEELSSISNSLSKKLQELGINNAEDLLNYLPRDHIAYDNKIHIKDIREGEDVTIMGHIDKISSFNIPRKNMIIITLVIKDTSGSIKINKFFQGNSSHYYLKQYKSQFPAGTAVLVAGTVKRDKYGSKTIQNPVLEVISEDFAMGDDNIHTGRIVPIYRLTEGLSLLALRKLIYKTLQNHKEDIKEFMPSDIIKRYSLMDYAEAIQEIHFPTSMPNKELAATRLIFNEFFMLQVRFMQMREEFRRKAKSIQFNCFSTGYIDSFLASLPFRLTNAQHRVFYDEILPDMSSESPMHRLLQGDVGSGKTVVAFMALLAAVEDGYQGAVMVPTEILAEQHYRKFKQWVDHMEANFQIKIALLLGKQKTSEKKDVLERLANGQINIVIGTHALIQEKVQFNKLGLIVVDEQHRFGVRQRELLARKAISEAAEEEFPAVEKLFMTATPIPRTLALTMHGDLDISEIDEMPEGRMPIITKIIGSQVKKSDVYNLIADEIAKGNKAYIVFPLIDESETLSAKAASTEYEHLKSEVFRGNNLAQIGLVHGKLNPQERDSVMEEFRSGEINILVATTVIEVGVDVSEATVMLIESAERFGLAQLHQLRGRVGRNNLQSYCFLHPGSRSSTALERLSVLERSNNGFVVAQEDLRIRGAGDFLGVKQSGLPESALKGLADHGDILEMARKAAKGLIESNFELQGYELLARKLSRNNYLGAILGG